MIHTDLLTKEMSEVIGENETKSLMKNYISNYHAKKSINVGKNICKSSDTEKIMFTN